MKPRLFLSVVFYLIFSFAAGGKYDQLQFRRYTIENGLPVGTVWTVYQDSCGFIWFGTDNGLSRFDGFQFITITTHGEEGKKIVSDKVYDIIQGHNHKIYFATAEGISLYNKVSGRYSELQINDSLLRKQPVRSIHIESDTTILIATQSAGLQRIYLGSRKAEAIIPQNFFARNVFADNKKNLWIATYGKGIYLKTSDGKLNHFLISNDKTDPNDFEAKNRVNQIFEYDKNTLWILTERGIYQLDIASKNIQPVPIARYFGNPQTPTRFRKIIRDRNQNLWICSYNGLLLLEKGDPNAGYLFTSDENNPFSLSSNRLLSVMEDQSGSIWISNYDAGVNVLHSLEVKFLYFQKTQNPNSLPANIVTAFEKHNENILIGTIGGGLTEFNPQNQTFRRFTNPDLNDRIISIYKENNRSIWLGTWGTGLQNFDPVRNKVVTYQRDNNLTNSLSNNTVICFLPDTDNTWLWIGTFSGLNRINLKTKVVERFEHDPILGKTIIYSLRFHKNKIFIGTGGQGLIILNPETLEIENIFKESPEGTKLASNTIHYIAKDAIDEIFYLGTDKGISIFDYKKEQFFNIDETGGLSNNKVWSVIQDRNHDLWLSTNRGITRIKPSLGFSNPEAFKIYGQKDGLRTLEFSQGSCLYDTVNNQIFYGGTQGFYYFNPDNIKPRLFNPQIHITSIKVMDNELVSDTSVAYLQHLILPYNKNFLSFEFVSLDYFDPSNNLYQFKVVGQSNIWTTPSFRNYVSFPDLKEGKYKLIIRGTNSEGYWSEYEREIFITINPPWYRTNIAYASYILAIILGIIGFVQWRTYKLEHEKRILEAIVQERTKELRQKNADITASIQYAQRIQQAIINPKITEFLKHFPDAFVFFRPKDIVSGDFFWFGKKGNRRFFAAADCTGHGVPGAFMSIIGTNLLEKAIIEHNITEPHEILAQIDADIKISLNQFGRKNDTFDGMDIALCAYDMGMNKLLYAGAYRPLIQIRNQEVIQHKATRASIGGSQIQKEKKFETHCIEVLPTDVFYIYSDGMTDQFGGEHGRKLSSGTLQNIFLEVHNKHMMEQELFFENFMKQWLDGYSQIDDIILVGVRLGTATSQSSDSM